jgi:integrase
MSGELVLASDFTTAFPTIAAGLKKCQSIFDAIKNFEDIERTFLLGAGLSVNTYRSYLEAIKQFYTFTNHKHPLQVVPGDIEAFHDHLIEGGADRNTASLRIRGLKKFFSGIRNVIPFYTSPFELMSETLVRKLNRTKKGNRTKAALSLAEVKRLLAWLELEHPEEHAAIFMLVTSGLRASELLQLRWKDISFNEGAWTAVFTGKGSLEAEQELYGPAVEVLRSLRRSTAPEARLFELDYHQLWAHVSAMGKLARERGILTRDVQFSPHLFRRTYATLLYRAGMGLKAIQCKTRHASLEVLAKHYIDDSEPASPVLERALA